jgi:tetratricopeptide (TPR) repeat protein
MSGEALYERYKDALKRGHVASLRGRVDEALAAYAEAARIAPERSTPHTSAGTALMRCKRPAEALRHYEAALRIGPRDEAAMLGRAQALVALDRRPEAADAFDQLAEFQAANGKLGDAVDAARRGLELAEGRDRRRTLERLIDRLRASEPGEPGTLALEQALRVLEGPAVVARPKPRPAEPPAVATAAAEQDAMPVANEEATADTGFEVEAVAAGTLDASSAAEEGGSEDEPGREAEPERRTEPGSEPEPDPEPEPEPEPEPGQEPVMPRALDRPVPDDVDLEQLALQVEALLDSGDPSAPEHSLDLAAASLREGRVNAALDACYQALSLDPDDVGLHLALVQLYDDRGWTTLASEKLDLLGRLATLGGDAATEERLAATRAQRG